MRRKHGRSNERRQCQLKTRRGNSYASFAVAARKADHLAAISGDPVDCYECGVCRRWHLGRRQIFQQGR